MNGEPPPQSNKNIIAIVVATLSVNATIGFCVLGYCLVFKVEPNPVLLTAFVAMVNYILGVVSGILSKTSPTETIKTPPVATPEQEAATVAKIISSAEPAKVEVVSDKSNPVHTVEAKLKP